MENKSIEPSHHEALEIDIRDTLCRHNQSTCKMLIWPSQVPCWERERKHYRDREREKEIEKEGKMLLVLL